MYSTAGVRVIATTRGSRTALDAVIAVVILVATLAQLSHGGVAPTPPTSEDLDVLGVLLAMCSALPLVVWRRSPVGVLAVTAGATVLVTGLGYSIDLTIGPTVALYLVTATRDRKSPWTARTTALVGGSFAVYLTATAIGHAAFPGIELLHTGLAWAVAWFAGERTHLRREQLAEYRERARRAERESERERLLAVAEERTRIARDLHDSAGHAISVIAVQAGAARLRHLDDPERSLRAITAIEDLARQTAEDIDQIVTTLRSYGDNGSIEEPTGLASLDSMIAHHTAAGLDVTFGSTGTPQPLGHATDQAAYRILQEALTNAARHGAGTAAITLAFTKQAVELTITNPVLDHDESRPGGGHGLIGMRERATLLGGNLDVERANGTFRVHAQIPYGGHRT
jgi:signal transduction histidine kinase